MIAFQVADFIDDGHRDYSPSGTKIRLKISEEECGQYSNRYYFKDLCILCPDEKPMVNGHCQRCPAGQFVISNGCRSCDSGINYITPKAECDACPNRVYENGLCKPLHHLSFRGCDDNGTWYNTSKADCDACPNRKYVPYRGYEGGNCEFVRHGWQETTHIGKSVMTVKDRFYDEQGDLSIERKFYDQNHLGVEKHIKKQKVYTYFKNGQLRTEKSPGFMRGYYQNGVLAFEQQNENVKFYNEQGEKIGYGVLKKERDSFIPWEVYVWRGDDYYQLDDAALLEYFKKNYPIDFMLPFDFVVPESKDQTYPIRYFKYNKEADKMFQENMGS